MNQTVNKIGIISLSLSCLSLMLAIIPSYIIENKIQELNKISYETKAPVSFEIKGVKLSFTKQGKNKNENANSIKIKNLRKLAQKITVCLYVSGILAIFLGIYSLTNKKDLKIGIGSLVTAFIALTWQYIAAGVSIGIAIVVVIFLLANFS